jgi:hypothetical protein
VTISYTLSVTALSPSGGSQQGGTRLTVKGAGFSTTLGGNILKLGDTSCEVQERTDTQIVCMIDNPSTTHTITNNGEHPSMCNTISKDYT